jgi:Cof subfamily protein (haloacid dehalogenase superfamily)
MIKLIGIDVDGTLLNGRGRVPPENLRAIQDAVDRGVHVAIVTGRSFFFALPAVMDLPDPLTLVVHNGAIVRRRDGETLMRRLMSRDVALDVLAVATDWRDAAAVIFDRPLAGQMVYDRLDWSHPHRSGFRARNQEIIEQVASLEEALTEDPIQVTFNGTVSSMRALHETLTTAAAGRPMSVSLTEYEQRDFSLVDVSAAMTTKATGLAALAGLLGVDRAEVMAVGDNYNDREMLQWAGVGVVMGNATSELLTAGFERTGTNDEAGLAQAIRRLALASR